VIKIYDFDNVKRNRRRYSGNAGNKFGFVWDDENWILKFLQSTVGLNRVKISYKSNPLSEYIGSKIYRCLDIDVHEVELGLAKSMNSGITRVVVACKDFRRADEQLVEFKEVKNTQFYGDNYDGTGGNGTYLNGVL
jgi:hypothetical protein